MTRYLIATLALVAMICAAQAADDAPKADDKPAAKAEEPKADAPKDAADAPKDATDPTKPDEAPAKASPFKTDKEKVSYFIGMSIGRNLRREGMFIDPQVLAQGVADALNNVEPKLTLDEARPALMAFEKEAMAKQQEIRDQEAAAAKLDAQRNKQIATNFLAENGKREGIKTTQTGMQYQVIRDGDGKMPKATDTVRTHYRGALLDGTEFDSSYKRGQPATFPVNGVIKGWVEALQLMKVGSKWKLWIPAELAYGDNPPPGSEIKAGSLLVFEVELLGIEE